MRFPTGPLTAEDIEGCEFVETQHGDLVTEYQYRSLCLLDDQFYRYRAKKYQDYSVSVFEIEEFKPLFNEIHRAVKYLVSQGYTTHDALIEFLKPAAQKARKDEDESGIDS